MSLLGRSFGKLQTLRSTPLTEVRSVLQTASCTPVQIPDRCTRSTRQTEISFGTSPAAARYSTGHRSWTAPSIGDRATEISKEPEITKCSPLVWPAIMATTPTITVGKTDGD